MNKEEVKLLVLETGILWPHYKEKKALSASTLTKILREIEYKEIPKYILLKAAERGKNFHKTIQEFIQTGDYPPFIDLAAGENLSKLDIKVHETINFLKKNKSLKPNRFLGGERLHHVFYKGVLLATYLDLEFQDYAVELKTNSVKINENSLTLLIFEIQLLIQYLCTGKDIYLLWSTGKGVIFHKFQVSDYSLKLLDMLIDLVNNDEVYSPTVKESIVQQIANDYHSLKNSHFFLPKISE